MTFSRASVVSDPGRKAYCVREICFVFRRCSISWSLIMVSRSLAIMGRREMGRKLVGSVVSPPLYSSISLVYLSESGYCPSSMELLKRGPG